MLAMLLPYSWLLPQSWLLPGRSIAVKRFTVHIKPQMHTYWKGYRRNSRQRHKPAAKIRAVMPSAGFQNPQDTNNWFAAVSTRRSLQKQIYITSTTYRRIIIAHKSMLTKVAEHLQAGYLAIFRNPEYERKVRVVSTSLLSEFFLYFNSMWLQPTGKVWLFFVLGTLFIYHLCACHPITTMSWRWISSLLTYLISPLQVILRQSQCRDLRVQNYRYRQSSVNLNKNVANSWVMDYWWASFKCTRSGWMLDSPSWQAQRC